MVPVEKIPEGSVMIYIRTQEFHVKLFSDGGHKNKKCHRSFPINFYSHVSQYRFCLNHKGGIKLFRHNKMQIFHSLSTEHLCLGGNDDDDGSG